MNVHRIGLHMHLNLLKLIVLRTVNTVGFGPLLITLGVLGRSTVQFGIILSNLQNLALLRANLLTSVNLLQSKWFCRLQPLI